MSPTSANKKKNMIKKEKAYKYIYHKIMNGTYPPGYHITINHIASELKLSNSPVREAMQQLESDGFLYIRPYIGAIVQLVSKKEYKETMYVLGLLCGAATAIASPKLTSEDIRHLERINESIKKHLAEYDLDAIPALNQEFHEQSYKKCNNTYLLSKLKETWQRLEQGRKTGFTFHSARTLSSVHEHDIIIQMIKNKVPMTQLEFYIRQHKMKMFESINNEK